MHIKSTFYLLLFAYSFVFGQVPKTPSEFLEYELGTHFSRHHQVVDYFSYLEEHSDLIQLKAYGKTNEGRLLQHAYISTPENLKNLDQIRLNHLKNTGLVPGDKNDYKAIVWLSYNVHGNESSGTEASMKTAHALITKYKDWLKDVVVILDPCINPDGRDRYVNFYNESKSTSYDPNPLSREHAEGWHNGRTNHYVFDLNRDWAWITQVESQQRLKVYNKWLPHIHVDYHEQGINSPYYFAPAAEPLHEIITDFQKSFQDELGKNHAKYFDAEGWFYFTKQRFDLLYPSYGDSYPTYLGAIGMTYEQAGGGRGGLGVYNGEAIELTLKDRIAHHYTTGISTVEMTAKNKTKLNTAFQNYFAEKKLKYQSFVLEGPAGALQALQDLLEKHEIKFGKTTAQTTIKGFDYQLQKNTSKKIGPNALVINTDQPKGKMAHVLLEPTTKLNDSLTYDITAWSLPYAYGLKAIASNSLTESQAMTTAVPLPELSISNYGYALPWNSFKDAQFLGALLQSDIRVRFNSIPLKNSGKNWNRGSLFVLKGDNQHLTDYRGQLSKIAQKYERQLSSIETGYSEEGPDLGADELELINPPKVAVLGGDGISPYNYGEVWHFFEQQLYYPLMQLPIGRLSAQALENIDVLVLPSGRYSFIDGEGSSTVMKWIRAGGKLIALSGALNSFKGQKGFGLQAKKSEEDTEEEEENTLLPYAQRERNRISNMITGSIYEVRLDKTHPLSFGMERYYSLKLSEEAYTYLSDGTNAGTLRKNALPIAGFVGNNVIKDQQESLVFGEKRFGRGSIVYLVDNPLFRGFWYSGKQLMSNAIFMTNNRPFQKQ